MVHLNSAGNAETLPMLRLIAQAQEAHEDVTTEAYPYSAGMTEIQSATVQDVYKKGPDDLLSRLEWPPTGERLDRASFDKYTAMGREDRACSRAQPPFSSDRWVRWSPVSPVRSGQARDFSWDR